MTLLKGRAELGVALFLALVGVVVLVDGLRLPTVSAAADPVGTRPMPARGRRAAARLSPCSSPWTSCAAAAARWRAARTSTWTTPATGAPSACCWSAFIANIVLIDRLGFVISGAILFWGSCFALGSRHLVRDPLISVAPVARDVLRLLQSARHPPARRDPAGGAVMDTLGPPDRGLRHRRDPDQPAVRRDRRPRSAPPSACCPGIGPAMTVALLLPITYSLEPTGAIIMFAGIYYGGMYGGSTTSILLNTPGESSSVVTAIEGNLMAKAGPRRRRRSPPRRSAPSSPAPSARRCWSCLRPRSWPVRGRAWARRTTSPSCCSRFSRSPRCSAPPGCAASPRWSSAWPSAWSASTRSTGQHRLTFGIAAARRRHRRRGGRGGDLRPRRGPVGRRAPAPQGRRRHPGRPAVDGPRGLAAVLEAVAARHRVRLPVRCAARRRRGDPDVPLVRHREAALQAPARSSARAPSRASPGRRRPTTPPPRARWCRCCRWACPPTPPRRSCSPRSSSTASSPVRCCSTKEPSWSGRLIASLFIGNALLLVLNLPLAPAVGQAAADPAALPVRRASCSSPPSARTR